MKKCKRFLCAAAAVLTAAGMLSACSSADSSGASDGEYYNGGDDSYYAGEDGNAGNLQMFEPNADRGITVDGGAVGVADEAPAADGGVVGVEADPIAEEHRRQHGVAADDADEAFAAPAADGGIVGVEGLEKNADDTYPTASANGIGVWETAAETTALSPSFFNTEEYNGIEESGYKSVAANPLSTFSIDVDTASYANIRRMIQEGGYVNPDAVRIEEFINYFDYSYPQPTTDDPFSVTAELSDCPWNSETKLMLVGLKAEDIRKEEREPLNLVFLIDVSGSMFSEDKLPLVQKAFSMLTDTLGEDDRISIVTYAGEEKVVLKGTSGADRKKIKDAINSLEAGGSTYGEAGINRAYELAEKYFIKNGNNRVLLATDGDLNVGLSSEEELTRLIEEKRESGVFLSVLGFGTGNVKDNRMEALADHGNGNYSYIDSELEAKKVLVEEMSGTLYTVAKDVKIQVEFNPANVLGYRLIGYENRALADEDFADDTKDAGEIGAGHTVTALYELLLNESGTSLPGTELKYQQNTVTENKNELLTVSLRYKQPDGDTSRLMSVPVTAENYSAKMSDNMTFAAAAAEFGMTLRGSEYKGTSSCGQILSLLEGVDCSGDEYKNEFVYLVRTMDKRGY
ncbi:MAG: VWA domain-containing protein [Prevotella sp.]|nr:VWA domain-containing protein [Prevotella sp.]